VSTLLGLWAGFFGAACLAAGVRGTKSLSRDLGLRFRWIDLVGVPIGVGGQILVALMYIPIADHVHDFNQRFNAPSQRLTGGSHGAGFAVIAVFTVVGAPFFEELFFRGLVQSVFTRRYGPRVAVFAQAACFAVVHYQVGMGLVEILITFLSIGTFGVYLGVLRWRYDRLGPGMVAHAAFNLVAVVLVLAVN
jgi:hypothetical protein